MASACGSQSRDTDRTQLRQGRAVFARSCASCHTLTGHNTNSAGGDLAIATLPVTDLASFVRVMPVRLPHAEIAAVAVYVHAVAAGKDRG